MRIFAALLLMTVTSSLSAQSDTLFTRNQGKIACKINEINESEIKYHLADNLNGPLFIMDKNSVTRYVLSNGYSELVRRDELMVENEHADIIKNRRAVKIHPFGAAFNHISIAYEDVIKVGMNLDVEAGYINSSITNNNSSVLSGRISENPFYSGAYIKPGVKFFLGNDLNVKGSKYAHPLKGRYIKLDLAYSFVNYQDIEYVLYDRASNTTFTISTDLKTTAYGGFVNYGRQLILGNMLTFEYYAGIGFTGQSYSYTNPDYLATKAKLLSPYYIQYNDEVSQIYQYHGFLRNPQMGLSLALGFRLGYIIPNKSEKSSK